MLGYSQLRDRKISPSTRKILAPGKLPSLGRFASTRNKQNKNGSWSFNGLSLLLNSLSSVQGHPMDLFLKISVLQANFCWVGDLGKIICPWRECVNSGRLRGFNVLNSWYVLFVRYLFLKTSPPPRLPLLLLPLKG